MLRFYCGANSLMKYLKATVIKRIFQIHIHKHIARYVMKPLLKSSVFNILHRECCGLVVECQDSNWRGPGFEPHCALELDTLMH